MTNSLDEVSRLPLFLEEIAEETGMGCLLYTLTLPTTPYV